MQAANNVPPSPPLPPFFFSGRNILQLQPVEMKQIAAIVGGDSAAKDKAFADGLFIAGSRYVMARAEDRSIYARQVR